MLAKVGSILLENDARYRACAFSLARFAFPLRFPHSFSRIMVDMAGKRRLFITFAKGKRYKERAKDGKQ